MTARRSAARSRLRRPLFLALRAVAPLLLAPPACTGDYYSRDADREVSGVLDEFNGVGLARRDAGVEMPAVVPPAPPIPADVPSGAEGEAVVEGTTPPEPTPPEQSPPETPIVLDLKTTLATALRESRNFKDTRESLYLQGLGFTFTRFQYGPQWNAAVSYVWGDTDGGPDATAASANVGVSQLLPTNGTLSLSGGMTHLMNQNDRGLIDDWTTTTSISLSQPLLRGAGYDQYRETLTQAERNMVYAVRNFELFRQQFTIDTTLQFFNLVGQKRKLANSEADLETAIFDENKQIELRKVDRAADKDVITARRRRLNSESSLTDARTTYKRSVERFLIDLGLDPRTPVELVLEEPPYEIVTFEPRSAVDVAMRNRLDVQNERDQIEDAERQFKLARNDLLPDLNVTASYFSGGTGAHPGDSLPSTYGRGGSASLEIPLQTIDRRNAWRQAEINIARTRRDWDLYVDDRKSEIEAQIRQLANTERQVEISEQSIDDEEKATELLEYRVEQGIADARDLTESRQQLIEQRNTLIDLKVQHLVQQLGLYKNLGILFISEDGTWSVGAPAASEKESRR